MSDNNSGNLRFQSELNWVLSGKAYELMNLCPVLKKIHMVHLTMCPTKVRKEKHDVSKIHGNACYGKAMNGFQDFFLH